MAFGFSSGIISLLKERRYTHFAQHKLAFNGGHMLQTHSHSKRAGERNESEREGGIPSAEKSILGKQPRR
jgi:hypothetical protein